MGRRRRGRVGEEQEQQEELMLNFSVTLTLFTEEFERKADLSK